jgi:glycosyltransferase involved in cell wall biosynthesis
VNRDVPLTPNEAPALPFVSVIVPAHNDADRLRLCLDALERQTYPADRFEVLVVDNNSNPPLEDAVAGFPHARCLQETRQGSYAARNRAVGEARGTVYAFTDADCLPTEGWIAAGVRALQQRPPRLRLVGGRIDLFPENPDRPTPAELHELVFGLKQQRNVEREQYAATANMLTAADIMKEVGLFQDDLQSGGDNEWGKRAHAKGHLLGYADDAVVRHPARASMRALKMKVRRVTLGNCDLSRTNPAFRRRCWIRLAKVLPSLRYQVGPALTTGELSAGQKVRLLGVIVVLHYYAYGLRLTRAGDLFRPLEPPS